MSRHFFNSKEKIQLLKPKLFRSKLGELENGHCNVSAGTHFSAFSIASSEKMLLWQKKLSSNKIHAIKKTAAKFKSTFTLFVW